MPGKLLLDDALARLAVLVDGRRRAWAFRERAADDGRGEDGGVLRGSVVSDSQSSGVWARRIVEVLVVGSCAQWVLFLVGCFSFGTLGAAGVNVVYTSFKQVLIDAFPAIKRYTSSFSGIHPR